MPFLRSTYHGASARELPDKATQQRLLKSISAKDARQSLNGLAEKGFPVGGPALNSVFIMGRVDEYAATYLLDRRQKEWRYELTCKHLAERCIAPTHAADIPAFMGLMEEVIDRARGRVKKEFRKIYRKVVYRRVGDSWVRDVVTLDVEEPR